MELINETVRRRDELKEKVKSAGGNVDFPEGAATFKPESTREAMVAQGEQEGIMSDPDIDPDILALRELLIYGLKGVAAYADHAAILGQEDDDVYAFIHKAMAATLKNDLSADDLIGLVLECGEINLKTMGLLDAGNTGAYGHPVPTPVPLGAKAGKAILGVRSRSQGLGNHLKAERGQGYLRLYPWRNAALPRLSRAEEICALLWSLRNCLAKPGQRICGLSRRDFDDNQLHSKAKRLLQRPYFHDRFGRLAGNRTHCGKGFCPGHQKSSELPGFSEDQNGKQVMVGFGHNAVMGVADKVIEAVKNKAIRHFFLVGGCDGAKPGRDYYTKFVEQVPEDCVVLTLACGKFRFFDKDLGDIGGIPRLLDVGQCNDAYSAIQIATALAGAFECGVNDLPLSMILSWYEQKACAILLTLLYLGIKDIRLGPSLPAFITPNVLNVLVEKFNIMPIQTPEEDLKAILG